MIIVAHLFAASLSESGLYNSLSIIAQEQPAVQFVFLIDNNFSESPELAANITVEKITLPKNAIMLRYWYSIKLPALLKKLRATHFISETGAISNNVNIPQYLLINNISFLQKKPVLLQPFSRSIKKHFSNWAQKASAILVNENFIADSLKEKYPEAADKIKFIGHGLNPHFKPINWEERELFLQKFSDGTAYFIAECSAITRLNILPLVKAFSLFKKRQKSSMKLVLVLKAVSIEECIKDFHLYKYRDDVRVISYPTDDVYAEMMATSYASIYLPEQVLAENTGWNALASGTALVTFKNKSAISTYQDAALYADLSEQSIADNMMILYKDEALRKSVIEKGLQLSSHYNWAATAHNSWQAINS